MCQNKQRVQRKSNRVLTESHEQRQWLKSRGKSHRLLFSDNMLAQLKKYFDSLHDNSKETINENQLIDPLVLFGMCRNKQQANQIFSFVDEGSSKELSYQKFIDVFRRVKTDKSTTRLCRKTDTSCRYEQFTDTLLGSHNKIPEGMSFRTGMSIYRRKNILNAFTSKIPKVKAQGVEVLKRFQEQVKSDPLLKIKLDQGKIKADQCVRSIKIKECSTFKKFKAFC